jgi:hypothetical protein
LPRAEASRSLILDCTARRARKRRMRTAV